MLRLQRSLLVLAASSLVSAASTPWQPAVGTTWQIVLSNKLSINSNSPSVSPDVTAYDIDLFLNQGTSVIPSLHKLNKKVICYFSAGTAENWRADYNQFPQSAKGNKVDGWPDENWINTNDATVRNIMTNRIKLASSTGCDAIDPDNMDAYNNDNGLGLTQADAIDYVKFICGKAASYGMSCGLKNALDILPNVASVVAFAVNEQCALYNECSVYSSFVQTKPVFHIEYYDDNSSWTCPQIAKVPGMSNVIKWAVLDGRVTLCPSGGKYTTATS